MIKPDDSAGERISKSPAGVLFIVPTPIGNLKDITLRALEVLKSVNVIACEDTRTSQKLLRHYEITVSLVSYHEHNGEVMRPKLLAKVAAGEQVALISDAGTPLISDPGYKLVRAAQEAGYAVVPLPGACAAIAALSASGLPTDQFTFAGFLPNKSAAREHALKALAANVGTLVFYESPKRIIATLEAIEKTLGAREVVLARELSKHYEEIVRLPVAELLATLKKRASIKGEIVLLVAPAEAQAIPPAQIDALLLEALKEHGTKEAARQVAEQTDSPKSELYARALELKK